MFFYFIFICGFTAKVACAFFAMENLTEINPFPSQKNDGIFHIFDSMKVVLRIRIRCIRKILPSWIRADPWIRIQGVKYQPKTAKKTFLLLKPFWKKWDYKHFLISSSFRMKISEKIKQNNWKLFFVKKIQ